MNEQQKEGTSKFSCPAVFKKYPYASLAGIIILVFVIAISLGFAFGLNHHERGDFHGRGGNMQGNWQRREGMGEGRNEQGGNWQGRGDSQTPMMPQNTQQQGAQQSAVPQPTQTNVQTQATPQAPVSIKGGTTVSTGTGTKK